MKECSIIILFSGIGLITTVEWETFEGENLRGSVTVIISRRKLSWNVKPIIGGYSTPRFRGEN